MAHTSPVNEYMDEM